MKKGKTGLIIAIIIIVVVLAVAAIFAVLFLTTDMFKTGQQAFIEAITKNTENFTTITSDVFENQEDFNNTHSYNTTGSIVINSNSNGNSGSIEYQTTARNDNTQDRYYADIILKNESDAEILKYSFIKSKNIYAIKNEEITPYYVGIQNESLKEYARSIGIEESQIFNIPEKIDFDALRNAFNMTSEEKSQLKEKYLNIIKDSIPEDKFAKAGKESIKVNNITYNANKYTLTLSSEELKKVITNILDTIKEDEIVLNMLAKLQNSLTGNVDTIQIKNIIENLISTIENNTEISENEYIITTYSYRGRTIKTIFEIPNMGKLTIDTDSTTQTVKFLLENYSVQEDGNKVQQVTISKSNSGNSTLYNIEFVPNTVNIDNTINISINLGNVTETGYSNSYEVSVINGESNVYNLKYDTNTVATDKVEEIEELTSSNTIILNSPQYSIDQATTFLMQYMQINTNLIVNKAQTLGMNSVFPTME